MQGWVTLTNQTGTTFQFVPYRGGAPLIQDLIAGQIDIAFGQAANYLGPVRGGQLKAFAVLQKARWWAAPDVPTMDEAGVPGIHASFWHGLWAPKGTPKDVVAKLNAAAVKALADPVVKKRVASLGMTIPEKNDLTPQALHDFHKAEIDKLSLIHI